MKIIKSSGEAVEYDPQKIRASLKRAGASDQLADRVLAVVNKRVREGMHTKKLYAIVRKEIARTDTCVACRYTLREALLKLGPAGFKFEQYAASILNSLGYRAELPPDNLMGKCTMHEVDIIASKNSTTAMIEAKFRNNTTDVVNLKDTLATWSRFIDLNEAPQTPNRFTEAWIITNARFSESAIAFGSCRGIRMVGWKSGTESLASLVDHASLYPITTLDDLKQWELDAFAAKGFMLCREITEKNPAELSTALRIAESRLKTIISTCQSIVAS